MRHQHNVSGPEDVYCMVPKHMANKHSSFGGNFDLQKPGHHQTQHALLENSCVTFQYYNSSKFASNSTSKDPKNG